MRYYSGKNNCVQCHFSPFMCCHFSPLRLYSSLLNDSDPARGCRSRLWDEWATRVEATGEGGTGQDTNERQHTTQQQGGSHEARTRHRAQERAQGASEWYKQIEEENIRKIEAAWLAKQAQGK